ncbi:MAG: hypothetical protein LBS77_02200 [Desulfovibrio sp.]|jgi:hypothetical protein|nr:hypothetical protein [Desulfovibrio sp.]
MWAITFFDFASLWLSLGQPILRLLVGLAAGVFIADTLEALHWTRSLARLAKPFARAARLDESACAAFALAFVSPAAANALLAQKHEAGEMSTRELTLANLFNSLPAYLTHIPSIFLIIWPVLGTPAAVYVGLTLLAAAGRTGFTLALGRFLLPSPVAPPCAPATDSGSWPTLRPCGYGLPAAELFKEALGKARRRFAKHLTKLVYYTVPVYVLMYVLQCLGFFRFVEIWLAEHASCLDFLKPEAIGVIILHLATELGVTLVAAASALNAGRLAPLDVVLALLVGNILSTPVRAVRHQLPAYSGFFRPAIALKLVLTNQGLRAVSMALVTAAYYVYAF